MSLRTSKYLIRTVLILLSFQFVAPAFVTSANEQEPVHFNSPAFQKHAPHTSLDASLFEKEEKEAEEEQDLLVEAELLDFSSLYSDRISASQITYVVQIISEHIQEPALLTLLCIFII